MLCMDMYCAYTCLILPKRCVPTTAVVRHLCLLVACQPDDDALTVAVVPETVTSLAVRQERALALTLVPLAIWA